MIDWNKKWSKFIKIKDNNKLKKDIKEDKLLKYLLNSIYMIFNFIFKIFFVYFDLSRFHKNQYLSDLTI